MDTQTVLLVGGAIAGLVAITKSALPDIPSRSLPLVVLAYSVALVGAAAYSGAFHGTLFDGIVATIGQAVSALGLREAVIGAAPSMSALPSRILPKPPAA